MVGLEMQYISHDDLCVEMAGEAVPISTCATPPTAPEKRSFRVRVRPAFWSSENSAMATGRVRHTGVGCVDQLMAEGTAGYDKIGDANGHQQLEVTYVEQVWQLSSWFVVVVVVWAYQSPTTPAPTCALSSVQHGAIPREIWGCWVDVTSARRRTLALDIILAEGWPREARFGVNFRRLLFAQGST